MSYIKSGITHNGTSILTQYPLVLSTDTSAPVTGGLYRTTTGLVMSTDGVSLGAIGGGGSGEVNTASNIGGGVEIYKQKTGVDLEFRTVIHRAAAEVESMGDYLEFRAGLQYSDIQAVDKLLTDVEIINTLVIGDTSGGEVELTLPELTADENMTHFAVVRDGADVLKLLSPDPAYRIIYGGYTNDQELELNTDGDIVHLVYVHANQTYYVIG